MKIEHAALQVLKHLEPKEWRELSAWVAHTPISKRSSLHRNMLKIGKLLRRQGVTNRDESNLVSVMTLLASKIHYHKPDKNRNARVSFHGPGQILFSYSKRVDRSLAVDFGIWTAIAVRRLEKKEAPVWHIYAKIREFLASLREKWGKLVGRVDRKSHQLTQSDWGDGILRGIVRRGIGYPGIVIIWGGRQTVRFVGWVVDLPWKIYYWVVEFHPVNLKDLKGLEREVEHVAA